MPIYCYACPEDNCEHEKEVFHNMSECDKPSEATVSEITCPIHCIIMRRVPQLVGLMGASGGQFKTEKELLKDKQQQRKKRARLHTKNEGINQIADPAMKAHIKKKYETDPYLKSLKGDHEKM